MKNAHFYLIYLFVFVPLGMVVFLIEKLRSNTEEEFTLDNLPE